MADVKEKKTIEVISLPNGAEYPESEFWTRYISAGKPSPVKYEIKVPKPTALTDEAMKAVCNHTLEEVVRLGIFALGHSADDVARLEMVVLGEDQVYDHAVNYDPQKHMNMQVAFEKALRGEGRRVRGESGAKVAKVKKETEAELIARLKAAGKLPADFEMTMI